MKISGSLEGQAPDGGGCHPIAASAPNPDVPGDVEENNPPKPSASAAAFALYETYPEHAKYTVWEGSGQNLAKWLGLGPTIVLEQLKSSRIYSAKFYVTIILFIFGFALCFIELGGDPKINQTAGKI